MNIHKLGNRGRWQIMTMIAAALVGSSVAAYAQGGPPRGGGPGQGQGQGGPPREERRGQGFGGPQGPPREGPGYNFLSAEMRFEGKVVKGAPYTATAVSENTQTLADGTRITRKNEASVARDSEGRTRREQKLEMMGPFAPSGNPPTRIFINDVVNRTQYELDPEARTARSLRPPPQGGGPPPVGGPRPGPAQVNEEVIGRKSIEGVDADGKRSTITIPAGSIGNDRPISIVSERWESPELQTVILSRHIDPRFGETTFRLTGINRAEPPHSLFEVPADYRIVEGGPPRGDGPGRGGPGPGAPRKPPE
jgi:hypothetical protein